MPSRSVRAAAARTPRSDRVRLVRATVRVQGRPPAPDHLAGPEQSAAARTDRRRRRAGVSSTRVAPCRPCARRRASTATSAPTLAAHAGGHAARHGASAPTRDARAVAAAAPPTPTDPPSRPRPSRPPRRSCSRRDRQYQWPGCSVRDEPGPQAPRAGVLREGTRVLLTGNDQTVAARPWREIETEDHNLKGWVQGDFLQTVQARRDGASRQTSAATIAPYN